MRHKLCSFHKCHKHTSDDGDNFGLNYAMGCRSLSMKTARDSCEVVVNTGRVASAGATGGNVTGLSLQTTWLASSSNSSAGWRSWPMSSVPLAYWRRARFRQPPASSGSRPPHPKSGKPRILPTMSGFWEYVEAGGLMSYGANFPVPFRQRRRLCRQDSAQDHGRISRTGNRAVGHRVRVPISRDQIGPIGQSSPPDRGSSQCGDPLVMIRVSGANPAQ